MNYGSKMCAAKQPRRAPTIKGTEHRKEDSINKLSKIKAWKKYNLENPNEEDCNKNNKTYKEE